MNILIATTEAVPFAKTGGLGDVCGALPTELARLGHTTTLIMPAFRSARESGQTITPTGTDVEVSIGRKTVRGSYLRSSLPDSNVPVYLVEQPDYFDRPQLYREQGADYKDNCERFVFFCRAALAAIELFDLQTQVVHCHDWATGLIPAYLKTEMSGVPPLDTVASLFTIHNLAYQGNFWHWDMELTGIDWKHFNWQEMEFYGSLSFLKSAIAFADMLNTVSPRYAQEIQQPPLSCGMEGALRHRRGDLVGIINGVNYDAWDPQSDPYLDGHNYDVKTVANGKAACKKAVQSELGLPVENDAPLLTFVGRLADQKGLDLLAPLIQRWAATEKAQWAILGTGEPKYHELLGEMARQHPDRVVVRLEFSDRLAHRLEAAADMFLMPSQYEPCGLNQLYSLKYGTIPIVRETGGLADTVTKVSDESLANGTATGFSFVPYTTEALAEAVQQACAAYQNRRVWDQLIRTAMQQDWSWRASAAQYSQLFDQTLARSRQAILSDSP